MIKRIDHFLFKSIDFILNNPLFESITNNTFYSVLVLVLITVFFSFPSYDVAYITNEMKPTWDAIFLQAREPFINHTHLYDPTSHEDKISFRLVPPLLLKLFHIQTITNAFLFQFTTQIFFYYLLFTFFQNFLGARKSAFLYCLPLCLVVSGHMYACDYRGFFDTLALDFLLLALLYRNMSISIFFLLLAFFTDERTIVASPSLILINLFENDGYQNWKVLLQKSFTKKNMFIYTSLAFYIVLRVSLGAIFGLKGGRGSVNFFMEQTSKVFYAVYIGLEGFLLPLFVVLYLLMKDRILFFPLLIIMSLFLILFVALSVLDINRSMAYLLPVIILVMVILSKYFDERRVLLILAIVFLTNLLYDDFYPLIAQIYRMKFITHSI